MNALRRRRLVAALWVSIAGLILFGLFFGELLVKGSVYYGGDVARIYLPQRTALTQAIAERRIPWWSADLGAGYPLAAEGEIGALYPPHWLVSLLFPPEISLTVSIVLHYLVGWLGFHVFCRRLGLSLPASIFGATVWTYGGFQVAHLSHPSMVAVSAWCPWMFALTYALLCGSDRPLAWQMAAALALIVALQFLAGHPQMSLLSLLALAGYAAYMLFQARHRDGFHRAGLWCLALCVGAALSAPQLLASAELSALSQRAGGLDDRFFTSYSFHPVLLTTYVSPFVLGNPYPTGSVELMGYVGVLPLALTWIAMRRCTLGGQRFFIGLISLGLLLSLGRWNPLYPYLRHVPVLNLFRVPARYLSWVSYGLSVLAGAGLDAVQGKPAERGPRQGVLAAVTAVVLGAGAAIAIAVARDVEAQVAIWRWLPLCWGLAVASALWGTQRAGRRLGLAAVFVVLTADLWAYGAVLDGTYNASEARSAVAAQPASAAFFAMDDDLYRVYTKEEIVPVLSVMRESLYPNLALAHGLASANLYLPLTPRSYQDYVGEMTAAKLNRLNVKYYLIPQLLPVDAETELYDVTNPFSALLTDTWLEIASRTIVGLEIESFLSHSAGLADGAVAAEILLRAASGEVVALPIRAGVETAEWAYERDDVREQIAHRMAPAASTWPARSGFPPREHLGHTYRSNVKMGQPLIVDALMIRPALSLAFVRIERLRLLGPEGEDELLNHLIGLGDHTLVYRSEDAVIYRNEDALPRAYALPVSRLTLTGEGVLLPDRLSRDDVLPVEVLSYADNRVELALRVTEASCLVLADQHYPGWRAWVDGRMETILPVDGVFRGVLLEPGAHRVTFTYTPSFWPWPRLP
ncbi:MAG: YfhO family protein [Chloroflexi bacterium]|nr:YfhO family protein [Chloroflexota bacterium]